MPSIDVGQNDPLAAEDLMSLPVEFNFLGHGNWYPQNLNRRELSALLNWKQHNYPEYDGLFIKEICVVTMNGSDCDMRYIYSFATHSWRLG